MNPSDLTPAYVKELRKSLGLSQPAFWGAVDVAQNTGSRYESGLPKMPKPVKLLLCTVYGDHKIKPRNKQLEKYFARVINALADLRAEVGGSYD